MFYFFITENNMANLFLVLNDGFDNQLIAAVEHWETNTRAYEEGVLIGLNLNNERILAESVQRKKETEKLVHIFPFVNRPMNNYNTKNKNTIFQMGQSNCTKNIIANVFEKKNRRTKFKRI